MTKGLDSQTRKSNINYKSIPKDEKGKLGGYEKV